MDIPKTALAFALYKRDVLRAVRPFRRKRHKRISRLAKEAARALGERIRVGVQKLPTSVTGSVTISAGAAEFDTDYDFEATLRTADRRMYEAKAAGRNCVV